MMLYRKDDAVFFVAGVVLVERVLGRRSPICIVPPRLCADTKAVVSDYALGLLFDCPLCSPFPHVHDRLEQISRRFCVGRVQYAGRGLVHRLPWPGNPSPRTIVSQSILRPTARGATKRKRTKAEAGTAKTEANGGSDTPVHQSTAVQVPGIPAQEVHSGIAVENGDMGGEDEQSGKLVAEGVAMECDCPCFCAGSAGRGGGRMAPIGHASSDLSRVEQLVGGAAQVRGCALGVEWIARAAQKSPGLSVSTALDMLDVALCEGEGNGLQAFVGGLSSTAVLGGPVDISTAACGPPVARPRRFEVAAALHRLPGVRFER